MADGSIAIDVESLEGSELLQHGVMQWRLLFVFVFVFVFLSLRPRPRPHPIERRGAGGGTDVGWSCGGAAATDPEASSTT